jgi:uncharacterized protein YggT (Ycf19 family)
MVELKALGVWFLCFTWKYSISSSAFLDYLDGLSIDNGARYFIWFKRCVPTIGTIDISPLAILLLAM